MRRLGAILFIIGVGAVSLFLTSNSDHVTIRMHWTYLHSKIQPQTTSAFSSMVSDPQLKGLVYYDASTKEIFLLSRGQWHLVYSKVNSGIWFADPIMAYDPIYKYLVLFGVKDQAVKGRVIQESQTWILSANGWQRIRTAISPPPLFGSSLGCDPNTGQCVLFGGIERVSSDAKSMHPIRLSAETWIWNGSTWKQIHTVHHPSARFIASMTWDAYTHQLILFGGLFSYPMNHYSDTWIWAGKSWHIVSRSHNLMPDQLPEPMTYDPNMKGLVLLNMNKSKMQEWLWDGKAWKLLAPNFASPLLNQSNYALQMQYDNADHYLVLYVRHWTKSGESYRTYVLK